MCGIVGFLARETPLRERLGELVVPMLTCMGERGPDSAGLAVFSEPVAAEQRRFNLYAADRAFDWHSLAEKWSTQTNEKVDVDPIENHAVVVCCTAPSQFAAWLVENFPAVHLLSIGRAIDIYKDEGHPAEISRRYRFSRLHGSHAVGHTRMATESAVSPAHAHPFTAGEDFCLVHNGSLSNPYMLRRKLERQGLAFETDNDTEAACRFIEWRMRQGESLDQALHVAFEELDGFY